MKLFIISTIIFCVSTAAWATANGNSVYSAQLFDSRDQSLMSDSLVFEHIKRSSKVVVRTGMAMQLKTDREKFDCEFIEASNDSIRISREGKAQVIALANVSRLVIYADTNVMKGVLRLVVTTSCVSAYGLGTVALIGGIATVGKNALLGAGLITVSLPLIYYAIKLHLQLKNANRKIVDLRKGWIVMPAGISTVK